MIETRIRGAGRPGRPGLTLIEVLIALVVTSILLLAVMTLCTEGQKHVMNQAAMTDVLEDARFPLVWISRDVKSAIGVAAAYGGFTTSGSVLVLQVPAVDADGYIIDVNGAYDYIVYRRRGRYVERNLIAVSPSARTSAARILADNITGLAFTYYDDAEAALASGFDAAVRVKADIATDVRGAQRLLTQSLDSSFKLRNR